MSLKLNWRWLPTALLAATLLAGCGGTSAPPTQADAAPTVGTNDTSEPLGGQAYPAPEQSSAYPAPEQSSAYPAPQQSQTEPGRPPEPPPTPSSDMGVVYGTLYNSATDQPLYDGVIVFLSPVVETDSQNMGVVAADTTGDRRVVPDVQGGFAFGDVPPGRYGIVVQGPLNQYLARYGNDTSKDVVFSVDAGQSLNLEKIYSGYP